ncbi:hypothetical protein [Pseudomonas sp. XK-1]|uniref:hypothetical protein n=1 Tax=Pseudomonas sp. XK-1 TaxID=3136019 RepID=UPI003119C282
MLELWQAHLTFALLLFLLIPGFGLLSGGRSLVLLGCLLIGFVPLAGLSLAAYVRSFTDDLAITTLLALLFASLVRIGLLARLKAPQGLQLLLLFGLLALFLYPATLGLTASDPYRLGYSPRSLLVVLALVALALLLARNWLGVWMLGLATLAFSLGLKSSGNYWDYLIDPLLALYCWGALIWHAVIRLGLRQRKTQLPMRL